MKYRVRQSVGRFKQQLADQQDEIRPGVPRPRLVTRHEAANYCRLSPQAFSLWVKEGRLPTALAGTARWDLKSIDAALTQPAVWRSTVVFPHSTTGRLNVRVHLKGVHRVNKRLASGQIKRISMLGVVVRGLMPSPALRISFDFSTRLINRYASRGQAPS